MSQGRTTLRFVTWNTCGIRRPPEKFSDVLRSLNDLQADVVFIQETQVGSNCYSMLTDVKDWHVYFTVHHPKTKGVAILIKKRDPSYFNYICHDEDCSGGYIVLFCHLYGELYTLVNVYNHKADRNVLGRLKEYLMETAEGVLVVGGDFNTVLHPCFDRSPSTSRHSPFKAILEDFTVSLNLRDTWSYLHSADQGFTRQQNESQSRIDMFFMQSETVGRALDISVEHSQISDHNPVVLEVEVWKQMGNTFPKVSLLLRENSHRRPIRMSGKISGAEILSAIKTLADSEQRPGEKQVEYYKRDHCPDATEILKIKFNIMLKTNCVSEAFRESYSSRGRHIFSVQYMILSQILAKRLSAYIVPYFRQEQKKNLDKYLTVTFESTQKIRLAFIKKCVGLKNKLESSIPPAKFHILGSLLSEIEGFSGELRCLLPGCPLTNAILNLALHNLDRTLNCEEGIWSTACFQRQALLIHAHRSKQEQVDRVLEEFHVNSGLELHRIVPQDSDS